MCIRDSLCIDRQPEVGPLYPKDSNTRYSITVYIINLYAARYIIILNKTMGFGEEELTLGKKDKYNNNKKY